VKILKYFKLQPKNFQLISEIRIPFRRLSAKPHQSKPFGVLASQLFGRSVAYFFHPLRSTGEKLKG
jgi:hypothetical protein